MPPVPRHVVCMTLKAEVFYLTDAGGAVGAEYQAENLGNEVVKLPAVLRVGIFYTIRTARVFVFYAAQPYIAP